MATKAFVLIETAVGKTREVVDALSSVEGLTSVDAVTGPYDVIVVMEADDLNTIGEMVTSRVHTVGNVVRTVTCLGVSLP
ncbi:MAG: Lrp/AsnC ligand binding domain-containing protein [Dehalococcoidia bacterium]